MRLLLLPISTRRALIYFDHTVHKGAAAAAGTKPSIQDRIITKASTTWSDWEKSDTTWKLKIVQYGNILFRRIPFEEWGLKSIPPLSKADKERFAKSDKGPPAITEKVELKYPAQYVGLMKPGINDMLKKIATERQGLHSKRLTYCFIGMPFTAPVAILPV